MSSILQINVEANLGSTGRISENIGKLILSEGWDSYIAFGRKHRKSTSTLIPIGNKADNLVHVAHTRLLDRHGLASTNVTKGLINEIRRINPSIIHLHNIHGYYLNYEVLFAFLATLKTPVVWTLHDCWPLTGHCTHFVEVNCMKWQTQCDACPQLNVYPASWGRDRSKKNHHQKIAAFTSLKNLTIVPVSKWLTEIVQISHLADQSIKTITNGIDISVFQPKLNTNLRSTFNLNNKFTILGVASVWSPNKGLNDFILLSKKLTSNEVIVLIGLNRKQISQLPQNIIGIERTDSTAELADWYSTADVYVNTSLEESFGLTTAEALACGTPIIVYNTTASPEMVVPAVGLAIEKDGALNLYKSILQIRDKGKNYFTKACRKRAVDLYDKNRTFSKYIELYSSLLAGN